MNLSAEWVRAADAQLTGEKLTSEQEATIVAMLEACASEPEAALEHILDILELDPSEEIVGYLGAGPLEDLLIKHGDTFLEKIIERSSVNRRLLKCLSYVDLDKEDFARAEEIYSFLRSQEK